MKTFGIMEANECRIMEIYQIWVAFDEFEFWNLHLVGPILPPGEFFEC